MMAVRARAAAVMAASDRRSSIPVEFVGQSWSSWIDKNNVSASEASNTEECSKNVKKRMETMTLRKEDMSIYGHCPAHDDFFLVVCSHCGQVVKPQAFEKHCERRHGPLGKLYGDHSLSSPLKRPRPGRPPGQHSASREARDGRWQEPGSPRAPLPPAAHRPTKAQKEGVSVLPSDKLSQGTPPSPPHSSAPSPRDPPWRHGAVQPSATSPGEKPLQKGMQGPPADALSPLRGPRTYSRTYKKVHKKELDLDKHCGVLDPERKKVCTRLLTCNIHSIHQRRQVVGRSKNFDQLVTELKMGSKARERAPALRESPETEAPSSETPVSQIGSPHCKRQLNCVNLRPRTPSESAVEEEMEVLTEAEEPTPLSNNHNRLSSDESEGEGQEESLDLPFSPWHPKPLGLCTFGSRSLSCSVFTFDRRLHHLRSAVSAMVEQHLSAHLWKKIPQVADTRLNKSPAAVASVPSSQDPSGSASVRASVSSSPAPSSSSSSSSSLRTSSSSLPQRTGRENSSGQSETKGSRTTPSAPSGPGRPKNPVGRPSKQQLRQRELELERSRRAEAGAGASPGAGREERTPERTPEQSPSPSPSGRGGRGYERSEEHVFAPSPDKSASPASRRPVNGALSLLSKPRPTAHTAQARSPSLAKRPTAPSSGHAPSTPPEHFSSRGGGGGGAGAAGGGGSGPHRRPDGYDHKGLGKKRKASGVSPPVTPSQPSKSLGLSSPSHSSFFSWKKDSKGTAASLGLEKKLDTQKPKLHH
ncbi:ataxin-7-like protein 2b isoform X1 [Clupea harengus]|uniref:Ataxin-7-like protein 2b isoform X1 n=2 Tax=Clupea harengus TaxID=7950 RepID=A0A6P3VSA6_CLUHA|nr:ataxin-7-like protein 2b isoform X1 [Clupea harengus]